MGRLASDGTFDGNLEVNAWLQYESRAEGTGWLDQIVLN
jgi:hypothetical protein